jgi:hypothetical protein
LSKSVHSLNLQRLNKGCFAAKYPMEKALLKLVHKGSLLMPINHVTDQAANACWCLFKVVGSLLRGNAGTT